MVPVPEQQPDAVRRSQDASVKQMQKMWRVKGKREKWEQSLERFMQQFGMQPELLKNLHFAFVVLLRAFAKVQWGWWLVFCATILRSDLVSWGAKAQSPLAALPLLFSACAQRSGVEKSSGY
eukprot:3595448-Rhodomonas_salina.2